MVSEPFADRLFWGAKYASHLRGNGTILEVHNKKGQTRTLEAHVRVDCRGWDSPIPQILYSSELAVYVKGVEGRTIDGSLFAHLFNQFLTML